MMTPDNEPASPAPAAPAPPPAAGGHHAPALIVLWIVIIIACYFIWPSKNYLDGEHSQTPQTTSVPP